MIEVVTAFSDQGFTGAGRHMDDDILNMIIAGPVCHAICDKSAMRLQLTSHNKFKLRSDKVL